jgi:hypothetical protein
MTLYVFGLTFDRKRGIVSGFLQEYIVKLMTIQSSDKIRATMAKVSGLIFWRDPDLSVLDSEIHSSRSLQHLQYL